MLFVHASVLVLHERACVCNQSPQSSAVGEPLVCSPLPWTVDVRCCSASTASTLGRRSKAFAGARSFGVGRESSHARAYQSEPAAAMRAVAQQDALQQSGLDRTDACGQEGGPANGAVSGVWAMAVRGGVGGEGWTVTSPQTVT